MQETVSLVVAATALGQAALCLSLLFARPSNPATLPLAAVFAVAILIALPQPMTSLLPRAASLLTAISLPAHLGLAPALWLYVQALTAESPWRPQPGHARHAIPAALGGAALLCVILLPAAERDAMMVHGEIPASPFALGVGVFIFVLIVIWIGQTVAYAWRILSHLAAYRRRLRDLFTNTDQKDLEWVTILIGVMALVWLAALLQVAVDGILNLTLLSPAWLHGLGLLALWAFAICGLRQKPGFDGGYLLEAGTPETSPKKYQKSALGPEQAQRVANRIEAAMRDDRLYLDANLSLQKLAAHIAVAPNTISQTLNETLGESFFAYVNR